MQRQPQGCGDRTQESAPPTVSTNSLPLTTGPQEMRIPLSPPLTRTCCRRTLLLHNHTNAHGLGMDYEHGPLVGFLTDEESLALIRVTSTVLRGVSPLPQGNVT